MAPDAKEALEASIRIANEIGDCGPLGIETTLTSAHLAIDHGEEEALSKLDGQFGALGSDGYRQWGPTDHLEAEACDQ